MSKRQAPRLVRFRAKGNETGIVFIHGYSGEAEKTWGKLPWILATEPSLREWDVVSLGYPSSLIASLRGIWKKAWIRQPPLQTLADGLHTRFTYVEPLKSYRQVVLVAHSMGGLVVQRALLDSDTVRKKAYQVFLFGTPCGGLPLAARLRWINPQVRDMAAGGDFIRELRRGWEALGSNRAFQFLSIQGEEDAFVTEKSTRGPFHCLDGLHFPREEWDTVAGNHVEMVKPLNREDEAPQLLIGRILGDAAPSGPWSSAWVARSKAEARETIERLGAHPAGLDAQALVSLALAYDTIGERQKAMEVLHLVKEDDADGMGTLGGRFKRAWQDEHRASDAEQALAWYTRGYETAVRLEQPRLAYYNGINLAYLRLAAQADLEGARKVARDVLEWVSRSTEPDPPWKAATQAEALAYLGDIGGALTKYREALASEPRPAAWAIASMYRQAKKVAHHLPSPSLSEGVERVFRS